MPPFGCGINAALRIGCDKISPHCVRRNDKGLCSLK